MMDKQCIGAHIREARKAASMTQEQLAEKAGLSVNFVSQLEAGVKGVSLHSLECIASALGVMPEFLIQSNVPDSAVSALLNDCTDGERQVIFDVAWAVKDSLRRHMPVAAKCLNN